MYDESETLSTVVKVKRIDKNTIKGRGSINLSNGNA